MTAYERQCINWLRRELRDELGVPFEGPGRKRRLTEPEARAVALIVAAQPHGTREHMIQRIAERLAIGISTLRRAILTYRPKPKSMTLHLPDLRSSE